MENPAYPKGARFVIPFLSPMVGDLFVGCVCDKMSLAAAALSIDLSDLAH